MQIKSKTIQAEGIKLFIENENKEVGRAFLYVLHNDLHNRPFGLIEDVFVEESERGKGLGSQLVEALINEARNQNCYKLILTSRHSKPEVHKMYEKAGFEDWGKEFRMNL